MYRTRQKATSIEVLEESIRISEENVSYENKTMETVSDNMSVIPAVLEELIQTVVLKIMILDLG